MSILGGKPRRLVFMKKKVELVKVIKKTTAVTMAATTAVGSVGMMPQSVSGAEEASKYIIRDNEYMTRLKLDYSKNPQFDISFYEDNKSGEIIFTREMAESLLEGGKIRVNDGREWTFSEAGLSLSNERTNSSFTSRNIDFVKDFYQSDKLNIKVITPEGHEVGIEIENSLSDEDKINLTEKIKDTASNGKNTLKILIDEAKSKDKSLYTEDSVNKFAEKLTNAENIYAKEGATAEEVNSAKSSLKSAMDSLEEKPASSSSYVIEDRTTGIVDSWGTKRFDITIKGEGEGRETSAIIKDEDEFIRTTEIKLDGKSYGKMSELGFIGKKWPGANTFRLEDLSKIEDLLGKRKIKVSLVLSNGEVLNFNVTNKLVAADENENTDNNSSTTVENTNNQPSNPNQPTNNNQPANTEDATANNNTSTNVSQGSFYTAQVMLMHSSNGASGYEYEQQSMAGPVLGENAEIVETSNGKKLIMHFNVATIMGATSYATDLKLTTKAFASLDKDDNGDIGTTFKLFADNTGVCIVDLPELKDKVFEGHIYSNIMDNTVALKVSNIQKSGNIREKLDELIRSSEQKTAGKEFYSAGKSEFDTALSNARKNENLGESYVNLLLASAGLREKLENPFADGKLFFIPVQATSVFASPTTGEKLLKPWGRVTKVDGRTNIELNYTTYSDFTGKVELGRIEIFDKEGHPIEGVELEKYSDGSAKVKFDMPFYPDSGIFKTKLYDKNGRGYDSDLILDYGNIQKEILPQLLEEAIHDVDYYRTGWVGPYDGMISRDRGDFYTEKSFSKYIEVLNKCKEDLKPENRVNLTQDIIDEDIKLLYDAKKNLMYKAMAGKGNTANLGVNGISNPGNVYNTSEPQVIEAPWAGSKVRFGDHVYKVLNTGKRRNSNNEEVETGTLLIMADDYTVNKPWCNSEPSENQVVKWNDSDLRRYLNGEFLNNFSELEKSAIKEVEIDTYDALANFISMSTDKMSQPIKTRDKVYILDVDDIKSAEYGFINQGSRKTTKYYFLRNLGRGYYETEYKLSGVKPKGNIETFNQTFNRATDSYPVMNIDKSKIGLTLKSGSVIHDGLTEVEATESNVWDIVLKNNDLDLNISNISANKNKISLDYSTNNSVGTDMLAVLVEGNDIATGRLKSIGKVGRLNESGKIEFKVPNYDSSKDKLYVMPIDTNLPMSVGEAKLIDTTNLKADKSQLLSGIREAKRYNLDAYKPDSTSKLREELNKAEKIYSNDDATKQEIDTAVEKIREGISQLVKKEIPTANGYEIPVSMIKKGSSDLSMANNAIEHTAKIVEQNGKNKVILTFKPMRFLGLEGHLLNMEVNGKNVTVEDRYENGHIKTVSFELSDKPSLVPARVEVDAMNEINGGKKAPQDVNIGLDWSSKSLNEVFDEKKAIDGDITNAIIKDEAFNIEVKEDAKGELIDKIVVEIPLQSMVRSRSVYRSNPNSEKITFIKKENKWQVSEDDKNKIKDLSINKSTSGRLEIKFKLNEGLHIDKNNTDKVTVTTLDNDDNQLHVVELKSFESSKEIGKNPEVSKVENKDVNTNENKADESNVDLLDELLKDKSSKYLMYDVEVSMKKVGSNEESMSKNAVEKMASIIEKDGVAEVTMTFKPMKFMGLEGHLLNMSIGGRAVKVISKDDSGRPTKISFVVKGHPERITAQVEVDAMNEINGGKSSPQKVDIVLDWNNKTNVREGLLDGNANYTRISGNNRIETAIEISKKYFKNAENVVLVSSTNFADALVSASYAKMKNAPILLTDKDGVNQSTIDEIKRLGVKNVTIIGGENSVSNKAEQGLKSLGLSVQRIAGANRYETSEKLADIIIKNNKVAKIAVVNGVKNADALAVSSLSTKENIPVVMLRNNSDDRSLIEKITGWKISDVVAIGGINSISDVTLNSIYTGKKTRIAGANRYETAVEVAKNSYPTPKSVFIANGETMIDALSAGAVTYKEEAPIVLVEKNITPKSAKSFVESVKNIIIVGGKNTISQKENESK